MASYIYIYTLEPNNPSLEYTLHMLCPTPLSTPFTAADLSHAGLPTDYTIPTKINIVNFRKELRHHPNGALVQWALAGFEHGFRIGYNGSRDGEAHRNLKSAEQYPQVLANNIAAELQEGRLFGPIDNPIVHAKISPIGVVPKPHSDKFRTINHLSYPFGTSINDGMTDGTLYTQYDRLDSAANWIRYFGKGCYLAKLDIESAFRNLPVHPLDVPLQYIQFEGKAYADLCLVFGSRSSPAIFNAVAGLVAWIAHNNYGLPLANHYLDDYLVGDPSQRICDARLSLMESLMHSLGLPVKHSKTERATQRITHLGIMIDTNTMCLELPIESRNRLLAELDRWINHKYRTLKEYLSLKGWLIWIANVCHTASFSQVSRHARPSRSPQY